VLFALIYLLPRRALRLAAGSASEVHNDLEIVVLRHQLAVLTRQVGRPRLRRRGRLFMAALSQMLPRPRWSSFVVRPQTLLRWHRELVRRKWTYHGNAPRRAAATRRGRSGADRSDGRGEPSVGCVRIRGELAKLGIRVPATAIRTLLRRNGLGPAPLRRTMGQDRPGRVPGLDAGARPPASGAGSSDLCCPLQRPATPPWPGSADAGSAVVSGPRTLRSPACPGSGCAGWTDPRIRTCWMNLVGTFCALHPRRRRGRRAAARCRRPMRMSA
jgi:hypothetical protein